MTSEAALYRALLALHRAPPTDAEQSLADLLQLTVDATGARLAYLALGADPAHPTLWKAAGMADDESPASIRERISQTILAHTAETGQLVVTHNATRDPRFANQASVRKHRIEQVLCAPLRGGFLYLQGRHDHTPFADTQLDLVQSLVDHLEPLLARVATSRRWTHDPTRPYRDQLRLDGIVGRSPALAGVFAQLATVAPIDVPALLTGPSGTGKTVVARAIHDNSPRADRPFVAVNCASLLPDRLHADLFGAAPGAYTGQRTARQGLVAAAEGGTLFLDEVGELPGEAQAQLLTFLQDRTYRPMGDERLRRADVRILAASAAPLTDPATFREDLYWRLANVVVDMPALSERLDDLPELAVAILARLARDLDRPALPLAPSALEHLEREAWPGNIRQLRQVLLSAWLRATSTGAAAIQQEHLGGPTARPPIHSEDLRQAVDRFKRRHVRRVLDTHDGNRTQAAKALGVNRTYLHDLLARWAVSDPSDISAA